MGKFAGFQSVELKAPQKSSFDLSHDKRVSTAMSRLTPILTTECIPGDKFNGSSEVLLRLMPLLAPIYDQILLYVHYFFVPNRLLWEDWEEFITGGRLGVGVDPVTAPIPPYYDLEDFINGGGGSVGSVYDYMAGSSLPPTGSSSTAADYAGLHIDAMPFAAYALIYMEYYRDRNYYADDYLEFPLPSGNIAIGSGNEYYSMRRRDYMKEYFTAALPFTQRGEEVTMPVLVSGDLPLYGNSPSVGATSFTLSAISQPGSISVGFGGTQDDSLPDGDLIARLDNISSTTSINDFRSAYALQVWLERNAVAGSRYTESIQAHFAVRPQDSRLQRPEYIGGGRIPIRISEIVATANSENLDVELDPIGKMAGHGVTYGNTNSFNYFCTEHGFIIGIASIMCPPSYHQGQPRMFRRRSFLDYPWPTFAKLGEQQIDKAELYADHTNLTEDTDGILPLFGYTSRYADWKYIPNTSHGLFHTSYLYWTLTRNFSSSPELGAGFTEFSPATQARIFAAGENGVDYFLMYVHNKVNVTRALPYFGTPNTIGF